MDHQPVHRRLQRNDLLLPHLVTSIRLLAVEDGLEDMSILLEDILVQNRDQANALYSQKC